MRLRSSSPCVVILLICCSVVGCGKDNGLTPKATFRAENQAKCYFHHSDKWIDLKPEQLQSVADAYAASSERKPYPNDGMLRTPSYRNAVTIQVNVGGRLQRLSLGEHFIWFGEELRILKPPDLKKVLKALSSDPADYRPEEVNVD